MYTGGRLRREQGVEEVVLHICDDGQPATAARFGGAQGEILP